MNAASIFALAALALAGCANPKQSPPKDKETTAYVQALASQRATGPVTIDVTQSYPKRDLYLQDMADVSYITLETTDESLLHPSPSFIYYVSDSLIVAKTQEERVVLFDGKGRFKSSFRRKGQSGKEYLDIIGMAVDTRRRELFIYDYGTLYRIQVYDFEGNYKRTLPLPGHVFVSSLQDYSDDCLLVGDEWIHSKKGITGISGRKKPYFLMSKQTGKVQEELDIKFHKRVSDSGSLPSADGTSSMHMTIGITPLVRTYDGWVVGDVSMDTLCLYSKGKLSPLLIRTPSVYATEPPIISFPTLRTPDYFIFESLPLEFDFKNPQRGFRTTTLAYDYTQGKVFECNLLNRDLPAGGSLNFNGTGHIQSPWRNAVFDVIPLEQLLDARAEGKVSGPLKDIAAQLTEESNPVLVVARLKGCPSE